MEIKVLKGIDINGAIGNVASFRIKVFREYPYLYDGDLGYEKKYLKDFANSSEAMIILILEKGEIIAVATSIPFRYCHLGSDVHKPFVKRALKVDDFYYYGEIMIERSYRNKGIAQQIYKIREKEAKKQGFGKVCFAAIVKDRLDIPPNDYFDPSMMWQKLGFKEYKDICIVESWPKIQSDGSTKEQFSSMNFWIKELSEENKQFNLKL